jgi:DNA helicase II / ATP-dependent DNA helicase PcrA
VIPSAPGMASAPMRRPPTARAQVAALLDDESRVTMAQRAAVFHEGNFLLEACPGSGKTRTIGLRIARISVDGSGRAAAAVSYTNVAVDEIQDAAVQAGAPIVEPYFVGTLHQLFLRYVFYPFGSLVMGCAGPPRLQGESYRRSEAEVVRLRGQQVGVGISRFEFRSDGRLVVPEGRLPVGMTIPAEEVAQRGQQDALARKRNLAAQGLATQADAMYYVQQVLERHPTIAAAVAARFDELIVDEAQDTNDVQLRCLGLLHATGKLGSLVLVGDFDQAIYSFSRADPSKCRQFAQICGLQTLRLTENFRSSQLICDVTYRFSSRQSPDIARGPYRDSPILPELLRYSPQNLADLVERYRNRLKTLAIKPDAARILVRTTRLADAFNGRSDTEDAPAVRVLGTAAARLEAGLQLNPITVRAVENLLATLAWDESARQALGPEQRQALRDQTTTLLNSLPPLDQPINDWIAATRTVVTNVLTRLNLQPAITPGQRLRAGGARTQRTARQAFSSNLPGSLEAQSIHQAKGESYDAVLLVAARPSGGRDQARTWVGAAVDNQLAEEIRVAYVALTRARRYLAVALPTACPQQVIDLYADRGFLTVD